MQLPIFSGFSTEPKNYIIKKCPLEKKYFSKYAKLFLLNFCHEQVWNAERITIFTQHKMKSYFNKYKQFISRQKSANAYILPVNWTTLFILLMNTGSVNAQHFTPVQAAANIDHIFKTTASLGGGAAFFDADNDGDEDLYITAGERRDHFYVNNGDGTFTYNSVDAGFVITTLYYTTGVIAGDIDNDGFKDLFITTWYSDFEPAGKNLLFKNNGDGTFTEIWDQLSINDMVQTLGATFLDYDLDGLLDIYTVNYVKEPAFIYDDDNNIIGYDHECYANNLYHNLGNGEFDEKAFALNIQDNGCGLATTASDFDMDGDMDILVANDFGEFVLPNQLYQYDSENGFYWSVASNLSADVAMYGMGIAVGDIDQDLDPDYYITNFGKNVLLKNNNSFFENITDATNTGNEWIVEDSTMTVSWGAAFLDIDNDTDLDLYVANGFIPSPDFLTSSILGNDALLINDGNAVFSNQSEAYGIENYYVSRGMAYSDYDNDGDLDIVSVVQNLPASIPDKKTVLYNNEKGNEKNWVQIKLRGITVNRDAFGSKIYLHADGQSWFQEVNGGSSFASHHSSRAHFGLDDIAQIDSVEIVWTGGTKRQIEYNLAINQFHEITEDTSTIIINDIKNVENNCSFNIFPNPASDYLEIQFKFPLSSAGALEIRNALGKVIKRKKIIPYIQNFRIGTGDLANGIYFIYLNANNQVLSRKIIKN